MALFRIGHATQALDLTITVAAANYFHGTCFSLTAIDAAADDAFTSPGNANAT
jgi:hypothetical protein